MSRGTRCGRCCCCCSFFCRHAPCVCLVQQSHNLLLSPCVVLLFTRRRWVGSCNAASECYWRCWLGRLTRIGCGTPLTRLLQCRCSRGRRFLLYSCTWAARMMFDSGPLASASRSSDGQVTEAAARILTHSDASWVMLLRSAGNTIYSQQRAHAYDTISARKEHGHCWTSSCAALSHLLLLLLAVEERRVLRRQQLRQHQSWRR
jgi:hypothetical protein